MVYLSYLPEDTTGEIRAVHGLLSWQQFTLYLLPAWIARKCYKECWLAKSADDGHCVMVLTGHVTATTRE